MIFSEKLVDSESLFFILLFSFRAGCCPCRGDFHQICESFLGSVKNRLRRFDSLDRRFVTKHFRATAIDSVGSCVTGQVIWDLIMSTSSSSLLLVSAATAPLDNDVLHNLCGRRIKGPLVIRIELSFSKHPP